MKFPISVLALLSLAAVGLSEDQDSTVTVTVTRTFTTCPVRTIDWCDQPSFSTQQSLSSLGPILTSSTLTTTASTVSNSQSATLNTPSISTLRSTSTSESSTTINTSTTSDISTSATSTLTSTSLTTSGSIPITTTSSTTTTATATTSASTTTSSAASGTIVNPGTPFTPSAQISGARLAKRSTVYIDLSNPNAAVLTTDASKAAFFVINSDATLETTLRSYPYYCGGSDFNNTPGRFYCDDSGAFPPTFKGWTNSPTFTYKDWTFCYKSDLSLYMSSNGPKSDCAALNFVANGAGTPSGSS